MPQDPDVTDRQPTLSRRAAVLGTGGLAVAGLMLSQGTAAAATGYTWVDNIAALKALPLTSPMAPILVLGYQVKGDGGGGVFYWNTTVAPDDGGLVIASSVSTAGVWRRISDDEEWVNPRWFGCKCDGTTDDTAAFQKALSAAVSTRRRLLVPAGKIRLTAPITAGSGPGARCLTISGHGPETSQLLLTDAGTLNLGLGSVDEYVAGRLLLRDLGVEVGEGASAAVAVTVTFSRVSGTTPQTALIENVEIAGVSDTSGPKTGLRVTDAQALRITGLRVAGRKGGTYPAGSTGLLLDGTSIPVEIFVSESKFYFLDAGIKLDGHLEGVNIDHCAVVAANYGIIASAPASAPGLWLTVTNSTTNTKLAGLVLRNWLNLNISNNLLYGDPGGGSFQGINVYTAVSAMLGSMSLISSNVLAYVGINGDDKSGIVVGGGPAEDSMIISQNLISFFTRGIYLVSDCQRTAVAGTNLFRSNSADVVNSGTSNVVQSALMSW